MPHTTHAYGFEGKVSGFAGGVSARFTAGEFLRSFLLEIDSGGNVTSLSFGDGSREWVARARAARRPGNPHLFYDPLDGGMEYVWLSWEGIEQNVMERLVGEQFEEADFLPAPVFARRARALDPEPAPTRVGEGENRRRTPALPDDRVRRQPPRGFGRDRQ